MNYITKRHTQDAVYWGAPTPDGYGGNTFASPVQITVRWEDRNVEFLSVDSEMQVSRAVVYSSQDVVVGGWLYLGTLDEVGSANQDDPELVDEAWEIKAFNKTPNIKGTLYEREIML